MGLPTGQFKENSVVFALINRHEALRGAFVEPSTNVRRANIVATKNRGLQASGVGGPPSLIVRLGDEPEEHEPCAMT